MSKGLSGASLRTVLLSFSLFSESSPEIVSSAVNCGEVWRSTFSSCAVFSVSDLEFYNLWFWFERYFRPISCGLRLCRRRFNHVERAVLVFLLSFNFVGDLLINRRGSVLKSNRVSHFGISLVRFQAINMYILPLFFISSLTNLVGDLTRSVNNLKRTVPRQVKLSGLRLARFEQPNKVSFFKRFPMYFSLKYSHCRRCSVPIFICASLCISYKCSFSSSAFSPNFNLGFRWGFGTNKSMGDGASLPKIMEYGVAPIVRWTVVLYTNVI